MWTQAQWSTYLAAKQARYVKDSNGWAYWQLPDKSWLMGRAASNGMVEVRQGSCAC